MHPRGAQHPQQRLIYAGQALAALDMVWNAARLLSPLMLGGLYALLLEAGKPELLFLIAGVSRHVAIDADKADVTGLLRGGRRVASAARLHWKTQDKVVSLQDARCNLLSSAVEPWPLLVMKRHHGVAWQTGISIRSFKIRSPCLSRRQRVKSCTGRRRRLPAIKTSMIVIVITAISPRRFHVTAASVWTLARRA